MITPSLAFTWFWTKGCWSKLRGRCFCVLDRFWILIGFYRGGVFLWNPFNNDTIAMRFFRFRNELNRKQLHGGT